MIRPRMVVAGVGTTLLMGACVGGYYGVPQTIADADPVPTGCPTKICPRPEPTHSSFSPEPEPTGTATGGGGGGGGPRPTRRPTTRPTTNPTVAPTGPTTPGGTIKPPPGSKFAAFTFQSFPFEQAFPLDPPPPPPPVKEAVPTPLVSLAAALAASVAATAGIATRRRGRMLVV